MNDSVRIDDTVNIVETGDVGPARRWSRRFRHRPAPGTMLPRATAVPHSPHWR